MRRNRIASRERRGRLRVLLPATRGRASGAPHARPHRGLHAQRLEHLRGCSRHYVQTRQLDQHLEHLGPEVHTRELGEPRELGFDLIGRKRRHFGHRGAGEGGSEAGKRSTFESNSLRGLLPITCRASVRPPALRRRLGSDRRCDRAHNSLRVTQQHQPTFAKMSAEDETKTVDPDAPKPTTVRPAPCSRRVREARAFDELS